MSTRIETTAAPVLTETPATPVAKRPRRTAAEMLEKSAAVIAALEFLGKQTKKQLQAATGQTDKEIEATLIRLSRIGKIVASGTRGSHWTLFVPPAAAEKSTDEKFAEVESELIAGTPEGDAAIAELSASCSG